MSRRCEILFEDVEAPGVGCAVRYVYPDGFNPNSPAHQLSNVVRAYLDALAADGTLTRLKEDEESGDMGAANAQRDEIATQLPVAANEG